MADELQHRHTATGVTVYGIVRDAITGRVVVQTDGSLETQVNANWGTYDVPLPETPAAGYFYVGDMPAAVAGAYVGQVHLQAGGAPAITDTIIGEWEPFHWTGTAAVNEGFAGLYMGPRGLGVYYDDAAGNTNTVPGNDGTFNNAVSTIAAVKTVADSLGVKRIYFINNSSATLVATMEDWEIVGIGEMTANTVNFGSQDVDRTVFYNLLLTGTQGGTGRCQAGGCCLSVIAGMEITALGCLLADAGSLTLRNDCAFDQWWSAVAGGGTPTLNINSIPNVNAYLRHGSGGIQIDNAVATTIMSVETDGQLVVDATCTSLEVHVRGNCSITDNGTTTNLNSDAAINLTNINAEVDTALVDIKLDHLVSVADGDDPVDGSIMAHLVSATEDWSTFIPSTDSLQAIRDRGDVAWITGSGTGTGARTVAVTVDDGAAVLENAIVRFTEGANTYAGPTNASGQISFSLDDATYDVAVSKVGYTFTPTTLVVDGDKTPTYSMAVVTISAPPNASTTTGVMTVYDEEGSVESGVTITVQIIDGPGTAGIGYDSTEWAETSSVLGVVEFAGIILGAQYRIWRGTSKADVQTFTAPTTGTSFDLAEVIGRG